MDHYKGQKTMFIILHQPFLQFAYPTSGSVEMLNRMAIQE